MPSLTPLLAIPFHHLPLPAVSINRAIPCPKALLMMVVVKLNAEAAARVKRTLLEGAMAVINACVCCARCLCK